MADYQCRGSFTNTVYFLSILRSKDKLFLVFFPSESSVISRAGMNCSEVIAMKNEVGDSSWFMEIKSADIWNMWRESAEIWYSMILRSVTLRTNRDMPSLSLCSVSCSSFQRFAQKCQKELGSVHTAARWWVTLQRPRLTSRRLMVEKLITYWSKPQLNTNKDESPPKKRKKYCESLF